VRGLIRSLVAAASLAAGSWVGLRAPVPPPPAPVAPAEADPAGRELPRAIDPLPTVHETNAADIPPWPRLNPEASITKAWRLAEGPHRKPGDKRRLVTLTFDDGPFPETTPRVLSLLEQYNVRATFFVIGRYLVGDGERARATREVLAKIVEGGHLVGNHTYDHALLTAISHTQVLEQIDRGASAIERAIGKKPILFRPPFGELDEFGQEAASARGLEVLLWSVEAKDMERDDPQEMFRDIVRQLSYNEGGIVLLHDIRWSSVKILKKLLAYLDARRWDPNRPDRMGYEIVDLPTYLRAVAEAPPQPGARNPKARAARERQAKERKRAAPRASDAPRADQPPERLSQRRALSPTNLPSRACAGQYPPERI
jgi:peptidoglycan/xylan/chitin deacetylase (PgdA/CDA1 family)